MMNIKEAQKAHHVFLQASAADPSMSGGVLPHFVGGGFFKDLFKKAAPIAASALKSGISGFAKGFEGASGDLGQKLLSGLKTAGKEAGKTALAEGSASLFGKGLSNKSKLMARPKIL